MKKTIIIIMLSAITLTASAQESLFKKYEDAKGVETVYVSKALQIGRASCRERV